METTLQESTIQQITEILERIRRNSKVPEPIRVDGYAGVGSRKTPPNIQYLMHLIGFEQASRGALLRSGAAEGADWAFYSGLLDWCLKNSPANPGPLGEIWVRQCDYSRAYRRHRREHLYIFEETPHANVAMEIASHLHPNWKAVMKLKVEGLHARNVYQLLGPTLVHPVKQVILYAEPIGGSVSGGTRTIYELARCLGIDCVNLYFLEHRQRAYRFLKLEPHQIDQIEKGLEE